MESLRLRGAWMKSRPCVRIAHLISSDAASMPDVHKKVLIEFTPAQLFDLVDRCEDYPLFLPWCGGVELIARTEEVTAATLHINYHGIRSHFSTENNKRYPTEMSIRLKDGPFARLDGGWRFTPLGETACKVEFELHYTFSNRLLDKVLGPVFNHIASTFVEAFVNRAGQVYGTSQP
jgi:ribosome-associated toxin RatA of RatAB toxin-antitoxin module